MSCKRSGCNFRNNGYDYCCRTCSIGQGHGANCTGKTNTNSNYSPQFAVQGQEQCRVPGCGNALFDWNSWGCCRSHHQTAVSNNYPRK